MADIVNNMAVLPKGATPNMEVYANKFDRNRATYAENKMLYDKARMQMAKDEIEVADEYQPIVEKTWNATLGSINDTIEIGDFIGLEGVIDNVALDYVTNTDLNMAKYNTNKFKENLALAREVEKSRGGLLGGYIKESVQLPEINKDGTIDKMGELDTGAEYFDSTAYMKTLFDSIKADVKQATNTDITNLQFITVDSFTGIDGKDLPEIQNYIDGEAKVDSDSGVIYVKYNNRTRGALPKGVSTISGISKDKADLAYEIFKSDHKAIAYFNALSRIGNKVKGNNTTPEQLMYLAANTKYWQAAYSSQAIIRDDREAIIGYPRTNTEPPEEPEVIPTGNVPAKTPTEDAGYGYTGSASRKSRRIDEANKTQIITSASELNDNINDLVYKVNALEIERNEALEEFLEDRSDANREKLRTLESGLYETKTSLDKLRMQRYSKISTFRQSMPKVREKLGLDSKGGDLIMTDAEISEAFSSNKVRTGFEDYDKYFGAFFLWGDLDLGPGEDRWDPTNYNYLDDDIVHDIKQSIFKAINVYGAISRESILSSILNEFGVEAKSDTDHMLMIQAITKYALERQLLINDLNENSDHPLTREVADEIMQGKGAIGIDKFLNGLQYGMVNKNTITGKLEDVLETYAKTDATIPYKVDIPDVDQKLQDMNSTLILGVVDVGNIYDSFGEAVTPDGSSQARYIIDLLSVGNQKGNELRAARTNIIKGGQIGAQLTAVDKASGTKMQGLVFLSNEASKTYVNNMETRYKEYNKEHDDFDGLTLDQKNEIYEYNVLLGFDANNIANSDRINRIDDAPNNYLISTSSTNQHSFNATYNLENYKKQFNGEDVYIPNQMVYNAVEYKIANTDYSAYFDYLKRNDGVAIQVTYPVSQGDKDVLISKYVYKVDTHLDNLKHLMDEDYISDLDTRDINYQLVPTDRGFLIVTYEPLLNSKHFKDFENGTDAIVASQLVLDKFTEE